MSHDCPTTPQRSDSPASRPDSLGLSKAARERSPTAGVDSSLSGLLTWIAKANQLRTGIGALKLPIGYFANVIDLGGGNGLAISTDGVGSKVLVAQMLRKYDTIGVDCVAMNVNDLVCVGAEPLALVDYVAVQAAEPAFLAEIAKGLYEGARQANVTIPGGEIAQLPEVITGLAPNEGFDLVATCVGAVRLDRILIGQDVRPGDVVVGFEASGIHSNGLTLARRTLFSEAGYSADSYVAELGRTVGEALLEPTRIYVRLALELLQLPGIKAFSHITSDGLTNLLRVEAAVGYELDYIPPLPPIFDLIRRAGAIGWPELFQVFNVGIGFCAVVAASSADAVLAAAKRHQIEAWPLGRAVAGPDRLVTIRPPDRPFKLVGRGNDFYDL